MLDTEISQSFELDYEIYTAVTNQFKNYSDYIEPQIKSDDIFKEFEDYVYKTKEIFNNLVPILNLCNSQRMNFRMLLIKMSKDRVLVDKLFQDEGETLILKRLVLQDELKDKVIGKNLDQIAKSEMIVKRLNEQFDKCKRELMQVRKIRGSASISNIGGNGISYGNFTDTKLNNINNNNVSSTQCLNNMNLLNNNNNSKRHKKVNNNLINSTSVNDDSLFNKILNMNLNLDFNTEKYNIISSSPIRTPCSQKSKLCNNTQTHSAYIYENNKNMFKGNTLTDITSPISKKNKINLSNLNLANINTERKVSSNNNNNKLYSNTKVNPNPNPSPNAGNKQIRMKKYSNSIDFNSTSCDYFLTHQDIDVSRSQLKYLFLQNNSACDNKIVTYNKNKENENYIDNYSYNADDYDYPHTEIEPVNLSYYERSESNIDTNNNTFTREKRYLPLQPLQPLKSLQPLNKKPKLITQSEKKQIKPNLNLNFKLIQKGKNKVKNNSVILDSSSINTSYNLNSPRKKVNFKSSSVNVNNNTNSNANNCTYNIGSKFALNAISTPLKNSACSNTRSKQSLMPSASNGQSGQSGQNGQNGQNCQNCQSGQSGLRKNKF